MKSRSLKQRFEPYRDVIIFMITLLVANYFWKFTMCGDEDGEVVTWFGLNITAPFAMMCKHIAATVYQMIDIFRDTVYMVGDYTIRFDSGSGTKIAWGCSGLKQAFIWLMLILTVRNNKGVEPSNTWLKKLWYIPLGWFCCYVFNLFRIFIIALLIEYHPTWFPILHEYIFKYLFYGMLFGLWVIFVEKIRSSASSN